MQMPGGVPGGGGMVRVGIERDIMPCVKMMVDVATKNLRETSHDYLHVCGYQMLSQKRNFQKKSIKILNFSQPQC